MICNASSSAGCAARWCQTARTAAVWLTLAGPAAAVEPSGSAADPFAKPAAPVAAQPTNVATSPSNDSAGIAHLKPIETPYVPYHATATSPWQPRVLEPPPGGNYASPTAPATPGSIFETIFDPDKLVPVVLPESPSAPQPNLHQAAPGTSSRGESFPGAEVRTPVKRPAVDIDTPPAVETGKMTPVTFGPPRGEKPANPAAPSKPIKKKTAAKPVADALDSDAGDTTALEAAIDKPAVGRPAVAKPSVAQKYHLPEPPIPLP